MRSADLVVAGCRELLTCAGPLPKRGRALGEVGLVGIWPPTKGADVASNLMRKNN